MGSQRKASAENGRVFVRRAVALTLWVFSFALFALLGLWNLYADREEAENRLSSEAGRTAARLAVLLTLPAWDMDSLRVRTIVMAAMEDPSIYAVKVQTTNGLLEGQRRDYQWEPVPWDDEIIENSIQGMNPLKLAGRVVGSVEVYLSPRVTEEDLAEKARREVLRFSLCAGFSTLAFLALLWQWGDLARCRRLWSAGDRVEERDAEESPLPQVRTESPDDENVSPESGLDAGAVINAELGRSFLLRRPEAWHVTAGLFSQTFAEAPLLLLRLQRSGNTAALSRLGDLLERAAPCVGAERLAAAAREMVTALNDQENASPARAVERCALTLRETLRALKGES